MKTIFILSKLNQSVCEAASSQIMSVAENFDKVSNVLMKDVVETLKDIDSNVQQNFEHYGNKYGYKIICDDDVYEWEITEWEL